MNDLTVPMLRYAKMVKSHQNSQSLKRFASTLWHDLKDIPINYQDFPLKYSKLENLVFQVYFLINYDGLDIDVYRQNFNAANDCNYIFNDKEKTAIHKLFKNYFKDVNLFYRKNGYNK